MARSLDLCFGRRFGMKWKLRLIALASLAVVLVVLSILQHTSIGVTNRDQPGLLLNHNEQYQIPRQHIASNFRGHLPLMRKDLDVSNYTSENSKQRIKPNTGIRNSAELLEIPELETELDDEAIVTYIYQELLKDDTFRSARNLTLLVAAVEKMRKNPHLFGEAMLNSAEVRRDELSVEEQHLNQDVMYHGALDHQNEGVRLPVIPLSDKELEAIHRSLEKTRKTLKRKLSTATVEIYHQTQYHKNISAWQQFHNGITQDALYSDQHMIEQVLSDMVNNPIIGAIEREGGTQLKVVISFANGGKALFKPMKFPREKSETWPNHYYFSDFERHYAEIAAYHLDKVLGFHRAPPVAGRFVNVGQLEQLANKGLKKTFFTSPIGNRCFFGTCDYYCDSGHAVCGSPDLIEGSLAAYLPGSANVRRKTIRNPWRRSYSKRRKAEWETNESYCKGVKTRPPFNTGRVLLDLIDLHILDFLQGNMDRHHFEVFARYNNDTYPINLDNGRGFGKSQHDEISILAPLRQCCTVRKSTLVRMLSLYEGPQPLSDAMRQSLYQDVVSPVLLEPHLHALDRRLATILRTISTCIHNARLPFMNTVIIDDGF